MFSEKPLRNVFFLRVQIVKHHIGIALVAGCKNHYLCKLRQLLEKLYSIGSNIDSSVNFLVCGEFDGELNVVGYMKAFVAVNQSFVKI